MAFEEKFFQVTGVKSDDVAPVLLLICEIMSVTGLRKTELLKLQVRDFDFRTGKISLIHWLDSSRDSYSARNFIHSSPREILISSSLASRLNEHIESLRISKRISNKELNIFSKDLVNKALASKPFSMNKFRIEYISAISLEKMPEIAQYYAELKDEKDLISCCYRDSE